VLKTPSLQPPYSDKILGLTGLLSVSWQDFFKTLFLYVSPIGIETRSSFVNNLANQELEGMQFDYTKLTFAIVEFVIHRISQTDGALGAGVELIETGSLHVVYHPKAKAWSCHRISPTSQPSNAGVTFSMSGLKLGQVLASTSNITGLVKLEKITWRARTMSAKAGAL